MQAIDNVKKNIDMELEMLDDQGITGKDDDDEKITHEHLTHLKHTLISFIENEIERLEGEKVSAVCEGKEYDDCPWCPRGMYCRDKEEAIGYNSAIQDQIDYYKEQIVLIKEINP